jgi:predicted DNA-binding transcriptional regulator AlpA
MNASGYSPSPASSVIPGIFAPDASPNSARLLGSVLDKKEVANLLSVPETWVATHWIEIPGTFRLGRNLRFRRTVIEEWLGGSSPLFEPEIAAEILLVNRSWVYAHADQIPGIMRLGRYIRFKPSALLAFLNEGTCQ